jgi:hypothetical protein
MIYECNVCGLKTHGRAKEDGWIEARFTSRNQWHKEIRVYLCPKHVLMLEAYKESYPDARFMLKVRKSNKRRIAEERTKQRLSAMYGVSPETIERARKIDSGQEP